MIPSIPFLAEGGIVTGPTLAMIGEGANDEAVIQLPKGMRDGMLGGGGGATEVRIVLEGDDDLVRMFRRGIADRGGRWEERLVGKEGVGTGGSRRSPDHKNKKKQNTKST